MSKKSIWIASVLAVVLAGCSKESVNMQTADHTITVHAQEIETGNMQLESSYIGRISADNRINITPSVSGTVLQVMVSVGDYVEAGDILCKFEDTSAKLNLENTKTSYSTSNQLKQAQQYYDSMSILYQAGDISKVEYDQAYQAVISARAAVDSAKVASEVAEYQLSLYTITAPISGVVEQVYAVENSALPQGTIAFVVAQPQQKTAIFYVTEAIREVLTHGQKVDVSYRNKTYQGSINEIGISIDESGLFKVEALLDEAEVLPTGIAVELKTISHSVRDMCLIPSDALYFDNGIPYVYLLENAIARQVFVETVLYDTNTTAISEGISAGQQIITSWSARLKDGAEVRVEEGDINEAD